MKLGIIVVVTLCLIGSVMGAAPRCRFAPSYTDDELINNPVRQKQFVMDAMYWEGQFQTHNVSYNQYSGHTFDGRPIGYNTGLPVGEPHQFSAPSKESLHVGLLVMAVAGNKYAQQWVAAKNMSVSGQHDNIEKIAIATAIDILTTKMNTYEKWNNTYPGFGGYFPWVFVFDDRLEPAPDWQTPTYRVPALDNGELIWTMFAAAHVLPQSGYAALGERYRKYFQLMADSAVAIFHDGDGHIRGVTRIIDVHAAPTASNYELQRPCGDPCFLDDPYEGELMAFFMDLYGTWPNPADRDAIWPYKMKKLQSVEFNTPKGPITVARGWWFSSHEQWKYLMLPFFNIPLIKRVFDNGERARTWNSYLKGLAGMYASVNDVTHGDEPIPDYVNAVGIPEIAFESVRRSDVVTPYGSYPTILANLGIGLTWYRRMLIGPRMQGPMGSTEAVVLNGTYISPLVTWDSKITTALAMAASADADTSLATLNAYALSKEGRYGRFVELATNMYAAVFPSLKGESLPYQPPAATIPTKYLADWPSCS